jgi:FlaA1/EpsC-like NDP-sugar epimerase
MCNPFVNVFVWLASLSSDPLRQSRVFLTFAFVLIFLCCFYFQIENENLTVFFFYQILYAISFCVFSVLLSFFYWWSFFFFFIISSYQILWFRLLLHTNFIVWHKIWCSLLKKKKKKIYLDANRRDVMNGGNDENTGSCTISILSTLNLSAY